MSAQPAFDLANELIWQSRSGSDNLVSKAIVEDWKGKRILIIGAARQGIALARYLSERGAEIILNDRLPADKLESAQADLANVPVEWVCGGHPFETLPGVDVVCPSGGVPLTLPLILEARRRGIAISNDSQIFLEAVPCPVVGITGSAGKTTTTTLAGRMANAAVEMGGAQKGFVESNLSEFGVFELRPETRIWVGGNIGSPLISFVDQMQPEDLAIMELSSFQLEVMTRSPQVAVVLNITPNHLDRHGSMEAYRAAKARILEFQKKEDVALLGQDDPGAWSLLNKASGQLVSFGMYAPPPGLSGSFLSSDDQTISMRLIRSGKESDVALISRQDISLRGAHNLLNVLAACAIASALGLPREAMLAGVKGFGGVPHRLEFVRSWGGADWYNDSIATAPERSIAAIRSFDEPLVLLAGGRDKDLPWNEFAELVGQRVGHLILFGEAAPTIKRAMRIARSTSRVDIKQVNHLREAVQIAAELVAPGYVVLLAPGGTSFDEFRDFEDRGEAYKKWVMELP